MMRTPRACVLGAALALLWGCDGYHHHHHHNPSGTVIGSGHVVTESRPVEAVTSVSVSAAGQLTIEQTGTESLQITAEDNVLPYVLSDIRDGRLFLGLEAGTSVTVTHPIRFHLTVRDLTGVEASGASRVEAREVDTADLTIQLSGASSLTATGFADRQQLDLSGASRCEAPDLRSRVVGASLSGASYGLVWASDSLVANASGASVLEYLGDPIVEAHVSGGSMVRNADR
jgi:hypothetical protein